MRTNIRVRLRGSAVKCPNALRLALCAMLFPICVNRRKSAATIFYPSLGPFAFFREAFRFLSVIDKFLFVVVSRQTKRTESLRPLWFDLAHHPEPVEGRLCGEMAES